MLAKKWEARRRNGRLGVVPHREGVLGLPR
jgi:hypothetical protein